MSVAAGLLAAGVVVAFAWGRRPPPARLRCLADDRRARRIEPATRLGRTLRMGFGREPDPPLDRRLGRAVLLALPALALGVPAALVLAGTAWCASAYRDRQAALRAAARVEDEAAEVTELFLIGVEAGLTPRLCVEAVGDRVGGPWGQALAEVHVLVRHGDRLADALEILPRRLGESACPLVAVLLDAERHGTPLTEALAGLAADQARERRRRGEARARQVPVRLLFPLVFCILPAFGALTVVPLLIGTLSSL